LAAGLAAALAFGGAFGAARGQQLELFQSAQEFGGEEWSRQEIDYRIWLRRKNSS
jgi:hypothetical protein